MISAEQRARIRRLFYAEHWKVGTISQELGVHPDTVKQAIEVERFLAKAPVIRSSLIDPYKAFIDETLNAHPRLRATRLYEMIAERGYVGGIALLRRYVQKVRPRTPSAYLKLRTLPGEQGQVDWGNFGTITVGYARRKLSCFVMVLSYSRAMAARFFYDQSMESFLFGHVCAFESLGGVPRQLLYDNLKSVVLERVGEHIRYHPRLLELAGQYHFAPRPCAPYRGNEKGKVERTIQFLRSSFFAARTYHDLDDLNAQLTQWIERVAHTRMLPEDPERRRVADVWTEEKERLLPLPKHAFSCTRIITAAVGKWPYIRFDLNEYSVPHTCVGQTLTVIASPELIRIVDGAGGTLAEHVRVYDRGMCVEDRQHIDALAKEKRRAQEISGRDRLRQACKNVDALLEAMALRGLPLRRQTNTLLKLLDRYGASELDRAIGRALSTQAHSAASVAHLLDQRTREQNKQPPIDVILPNDERIQNLHLTPHNLDRYDDLGALKNTTGEDDDHAS
jgi:transposase